MFQSETYSIIDAIYKFVNTYTAYKNNATTVTSKTDSILFGATGNALFFLNTDNSYLTGKYCMECDIIDFSNSSNVYVRFDDGSTRSRSFADINVATGSHLKVYNDGTNINVYVDDTLQYSRADTGQIRLGFSFGSGETLELTNLILYPI